jgi:hypothetical protein
MLLTLAGLILTGANYSCDLATFSNGNKVQLNGTICTMSASNSLEVQCNQQSFTTGTIGLFSFFDDTTQMCVAYIPTETWGPWITSAVVFSGLRWLFGIIAFFWLAFSMCCPIRAIHKQVLLFLTLFAAVFQGFFFLFYGNDMCKENGCDLAQGAYIAIAGACVFFLAFLSVFCITPLTASWEDEGDDRHIHQAPTADSGDDDGLPHAVTGVVLEEEQAPQKQV